MPFSIAGKTAIVTGAGSGINLTFAQLLLSRNCNVVFADIGLRPESQKVVDAHRAGKPRAIFVKTDVASWDALSNMFKATIAEFGSFDILCPGAGIYEPHWTNFWHPPGSAESRDSPDANHYALLDINLTHPIRSTQLAMSYWLHPENGSGSSTVSAANPKRVVHISSIAGQMPNLNAPLYGASKFGITGFVRCLAGLDQHGIRVNAVAPGIVRTPLWLEHPEKLRYVDQERNAWVTPEEVAEAMLRCVEDDAVVGGTILEVGHLYSRAVQVLNDPGPDHDPQKGVIAYKVGEGVEVVKQLLGQKDVWGVRSTAPRSKL